MASTLGEIDICNLALGWLGERPIASFNDESNTAELCKNNYPSARDYTLEDGDWQFARRIETLAELEDPPNNPIPPYRGRVFQLPANALRVIRLDDGTGHWRLAWDRLEDRIVVEPLIGLAPTSAGIPLGSAAQENIVYADLITRITDPTKFSPNFAQAVAGKLAWDLAMPITESQSREERMERRYYLLSGVARANDGRQGTNQRFRSDRLRRSRR